MMRTLLCFSLLALLSIPSFADEPPPFGGGSPDPIPVDGGASYLVGAGAVYAYRKLKARRQKAAQAAA